MGKPCTFDPAGLLTADPLRPAKVTFEDMVFYDPTVVYEPTDVYRLLVRPQFGSGEVTIRAASGGVVMVFELLYLGGDPPQYVRAVEVHTQGVMRKCSERM